MNYILDLIKEDIAIKSRILNNQSFLQNLKEIIDIINKAFGNGGKILIAGNGGSAADAQHFTAEIVGKFEKQRKAYPAIALTTNSSILTALSNDYGFDTVFSRQIEALAERKDIFIGISTSGKSANLIKAVEAAKKKGVFTICLLGKNGGELKNLADKVLVVPSEETPRIQEAHLMLLHIICQEIEKNF